jgi:PadR family transcriptional regulator PadR
MKADKSFLGEFEQMVLLAIAGAGNDASAIEISRQLEDNAERTVSRGSLYTTLNRMKKKGLIDWQIDAGDMARSGLPRRHFRVLPAGVGALRETRSALLQLWAGAEDVLKDPGQ